MKPLDSQGQRGVFKLGSPEEALCHLGETLSFSREDSALVECYYPSDEVTLSAFVAGGRVHPLTLTDRQHMPDPLHIGVCAAHRYPSVNAGRLEEIHSIAEHVALALGVKEGPLYIQFLIGDEGVVVNEAACRVGGAYEDVFIPYVTGFDILRQVIALSLGEKADLSALKSPMGRGDGCQVSEQMLFCKPGKIASVTKLESVLALPGVLAAGYNFAPGSVLPAMENATARFGYCVLVTDKGDMAEKVRALYKTLKVLNPEGENLVIPTSYDG
jgi:biotin carboxylase